MRWRRYGRLALAVVWFGAAHAAEESVSLNFVNADVDSVVKSVAQATGRNFIVDPRVKGTINIVSGKPIARSHLYDVLLAALRMQGFAAVESGGVTRILPEADAKTFGMQVVQDARMPSGDQVVTRVFQLRFASATQAANALRPLIAPNNTVAPAAGNTLVVTDYAANVRRIESILDVIDRPEADKPLLIRLEHAAALDVAQTLNRLLGEQGAGTDPAQRVTVVADAHVNALLAKSDNTGQLERVRELAAALDQPGAATGNIHVVYLRNAEAAKLAQTLRAVLAGSDAALPQPPPATRLSTAAPPAPRSAAAETPQPQGGGMVQADATANALIITAPEPVYLGLRKVIDMIDRRRAQVYVEALIAELSADRASEFGVQWQSLSVNGRPSVVGGTNFGTGGANIVGLMENVAKTSQTGTAGVAPGLNIGIVTGKFGSTQTPSLALLARALETDANANILSTPTLVTLDNEEAKIVIGQNVPFITGQYAQTGSSVTPTPFQTIERRDVGLTLKVRPQISEGGTVRLEIFQEVSSLDPGTLANPAGPVTNKRTIESSVLVDDSATVVLGGLIQDSFNTGQDKVPVLGDIPGLGVLFRYDTRKRTKTNLMVFLRPRILRDADTAASLSNERYQYILGEQKSFNAARAPEGSKPPMLPEQTRTAPQ